MATQRFFVRAGIIMCLFVAHAFAIYDPDAPERPVATVSDEEILSQPFSEDNPMPTAFLRGGPVMMAANMEQTIVEEQEILTEEVTNEEEMDQNAEAISARSRLGPWNAELCQDEKLHMECPAGYKLKIRDGFFGREDGADTCMEEQGAISVSNCQRHSAIDTIKSLCENTNTCTFNVETEVFGRPCNAPEGVENFVFYLKIEFDCELELETQTICEQSNSDDYLGIACFAGMEINIESAFYGRDDSETCVVDGLDSASSCAHEQAFELISAQCNGRDWCYVNVTGNYFGDECPDVSKYLQVSYTCAECTNDWGTDSDCAQWAVGGDCQSNTEWMYGYCRESCSGCHKTHSCLNIASYDDCYYWSFNGECHKNPEFMHQYCREACNLCNDDYVPEQPEEPEPIWAPREVDEDLDLQMTTACPDEQAQLSCPDNTHIKIYDAFYGRQNGWVCMNNTVSDTYPCENNSPGPFEQLSYHCNGRTDCSVLNPSISEGVKHPFENPCEDIDTNRYLEVKWTCSECDNVWAKQSDTGNADCDYWQSWYECDYNPYWMADNCFESCSGCKVMDDCENTNSDWLCDYWSLIGECEENPTWMEYNCARSCRTCWALEDCKNVMSDASCDQWAQADECQENPTWMQSNCAKACNTCYMLRENTAFNEEHING